MYHQTGLLMVTGSRNNLTRGITVPVQRSAAAARG